jgi:hypothetical protein
MELGVDPEKDPFASLWLHPIKDRVLELVMNTKAPHICVYSFHGPFALGGQYPTQREQGETIVTIHQHIFDPQYDTPLPQLSAVNRAIFNLESASAMNRGMSCPHSQPCRPASDR